jgi:hypothetical protein
VVTDAARRALWSLCNAQCDRLHGSKFRHVPHCVSGSEENIVPAGGDYRIDILAWVTVALNTDLEDNYKEAGDCSVH